MFLNIYATYYIGFTEILFYARGVRGFPLGAQSEKPNLF